MSTSVDVETLLRRCYSAFNVRDLEGALVLMHPDVTWANGWEGGWVTGRDGVRDYWQRQWAAIDPHVDPLAFTWGADGRGRPSATKAVRASVTSAVAALQSPRAWASVARSRCVPVVA
jgi:hypothetical protein